MWMNWGLGNSGDQRWIGDSGAVLDFDTRVVRWGLEVCIDDRGVENGPRTRGAIPTQSQSRRLNIT
jgi:hypothetical protein